MARSQNETYFKAKLFSNINRFLDKATEGDNDLGYIPDGLVQRMTDAAYEILQQNKDTQDWLEKEGYFNN